jgi:hypothetical protein
MLRRRKNLEQSQVSRWHGIPGFSGDGMLLDAQPDDKSIQAKFPPASLAGTEWILQDLAGTSALENVKATLAFPEAGGLRGMHRATASPARRKFPAIPLSLECSLPRAWLARTTHSVRRKPNT